MTLPTQQAAAPARGAPRSCERCGEALPAAARFCPRCGEQAVAPPTEQVVPSAPPPPAEWYELRFGR